MNITMRTTDGVTFTLDPVGNVVARSNGPQGWDYGSQWTVLGFLRRWNAHEVITLTDALAGADIGHGFVVDLDHGTRRVWAGYPGRCRSLALSE